MPKKATKKFYSITETKTDYVVKITKSEFYRNDPDSDGEPMTAEIDGDGEIRVVEETETSGYTLEEFVDLVDGDEFTFEKPLFFANERVEKCTTKGEVTSISVGCQNINKEEAQKLMKELGW